MSEKRALNHFFFIAYLISLVLCFSFLPDIQSEHWMASLFGITVYVTYAFIYLIPALLVTKIIQWLVRLLMPSQTWLVMVSAVLLTATTWVLLFADGFIYKIYSFHINGFVLNLVTTPGGIESMGNSTTTLMTFSAVVAAFYLLALVLYKLTKQFTRQSGSVGYRYLVILFLVATVGERVVYGYSSLKAYTPILVSANAFPAYLPLTYRSLAKKLGITQVVKADVKMKSSISRLKYPIKDIKIDADVKPMNIVWMVSESLRADMLNEEIMPASWAFAQQAQNFKKHYSGSNSTRMGVFSMFYGLYGNFWFPMLDNRQGPVLVDVLKQQDYQWKFFSSQKFSYPEFEKTVLAEVSAKDIQSYITGKGWQRDRKNVGDLIDFIETRDTSKPFMTYMFFESPHARYYFPPESIIRKSYMKEFNYATMDTEKDMPGIFNRYVNAVHHLDSQIKRILEYLTENDLLKNTIVLITGDHGEEFMENGHWGHGSTFSDEQTRTPMVMWIPGKSAASHDYMTSHLDIPATLLPYLGVTNEAFDYSLGYDMLGDVRRKYTVTGHWHTLGFINDKYKASFAMGGSGYHDNQITTADDQPVEDTDLFYATYQNDLLQVMKDISRFSSP